MGDCTRGDGIFMIVPNGEAPGEVALPPEPQRVQRHWPTPQGAQQVAEL